MHHRTSRIAAAFAVLVGIIACGGEELSMCEEASEVLGTCDVSIPFLRDGPCAGVRAAAAECILAHVTSCQQVASLDAAFQQCVAEEGDDVALPFEPSSPNGEDLPPQPEGDDASCSDDIDNDGDGFVDCLDVSCSQNIDVTVCGDLQ